MADVTGPPTREEIGAIPIWARVAFAARCARRVVPLFKFDWPSAPPHNHHAANRALRIAEQSAALASRAASPSSTYHSSLSFVAVAAARTNAHGVAAAAAASTAYATCSDAGNPDNAAHAMTYAEAAADGIGIDIRPHLRADFRTVRQAATTGGWTDDTPVPPWVFGPMWPTGVPEGWPEADPEERLVVTVGTPEEVPVEEVVEFQNQLHDLLGQLAIAHGATGLTIDRTDRDVPILVPAGSGVSP